MNFIYFFLLFLVLATKQQKLIKEFLESHFKMLFYRELHKIIMFPLPDYFSFFSMVLVEGLSNQVEEFKLEKNKQ